MNFSNLDNSNYAVLGAFALLLIIDIILVFVWSSKSNKIGHLKNEVEELNNEIKEVGIDRDAWHKKWSNKNEQADRLTREKEELKTKLKITEDINASLREANAKLVDGRHYAENGLTAKATPSTNLDIKSINEANRKGNGQFAKRGNSGPSSKKSAGSGEQSSPSKNSTGDSKKV